jgi:molecular chaperone DnaK
MAADNRSLGKFQLAGIPRAPRGVPQIEVTFTVLEEGVLEVSARDKATGSTREVRIEGATTALDKAALDKILAETTAKQADDQRRLAWSEARLKLDVAVNESTKLLASVGDKLSQKMKKRWSDELARAQVLLASGTTPGDPKLMQAAVAELQKAMHDGAEELYENSK